MSDFRSLFKHSRNYFFATLATKALSFISIPVYTRLLTVEDYGIISVFMSFVGIVAVMLTLSSEVSISRYYYDAKDEEDFKRFVGTSIRLTSIIILITTSIFLIGLNIISGEINMSPRLTLCLIPVALFNITNSIFTQIYNPQMKSKKIAIVSSVQSYLAFALSVVCIILIREEKYFGYVYGHIIAMILLGFYLIKQIRPFYISCFNKTYIPYILKYCLPYIPDALSGIVLAQFSRIFIGQSQGYLLAGSYSFVVNLATLMAITIQVTNNAWFPYYFRYLNNKDYKSIDKDFNLIWRVTLLAGLGLSLFGKELASILARKEYLEMIPILPLLVSGYIFHQWAYLFLRNVAYAKRMMWNTYSYMFSGVVLIILNTILVPKFLGYGAAIATLSSFILLFVFAYGVNRYIIKQYSPPLSLTVYPFLVYLLFTILAEILFFTNIDFALLIVVKAVVFVISFVLLSRPYSNNIILFIKKRISG